MSWDRCLESLRNAEPGVAAKPAIEATQNALSVLRDLLPETPPTIVGPDVENGIVVEWRLEASIVELTFTSDGRCEFYRYERRKA